MGCAGLSLAIHLARSGQFSDKRILLVDREEKNRNDRTWCFWETGAGPFEDIVFQSWEKAWVRDEAWERCLELVPYRYKMIRGIDFYNYCLEQFQAHSNITLLQANVDGVVDDGETATVHTSAGPFTATVVFNSILFEKPVLKKKQHFLLQHFRGWVIETEDPRFDPAIATLMDFRVSQHAGTTFVYVMPFTERKALVEYTLFTAARLQPEEYEKGLRDYIHQQIGTAAFTVLDEEDGVIPMTDYRFPKGTPRVVQIGTAGGQTKASSGYTFRFIQKHSAAIVGQLLAGKTPLLSSAAGRFHFYDRVLLDILGRNTFPGHRIFSTLFKKNEPQRVLRFLDNESSLGEELKLISSLPAGPFAAAALRTL